MDSIEDLAVRVIDDDDIEPVTAIEFAISSIQAGSMFLAAVSE